MQNDTSNTYFNSNDSIVAAPSFIEQSLFNSETVYEMEGKPVMAQHHLFWVPAVLVFCFILLAWGRLFFRRRLGMVFSSVFAKNYANQLIREGNIFYERIGLILFMIYLLSISLFVYLALPIFETKPFGLYPGLTYLIILGFFVGLWLFKVILVSVLSQLFNTREYSSELMANMYLYNLFAGILLLPIVACMAYAQLEIFFYTGLVIITLTYTLRIIREAVIGFRLIKFSIFHLILYLCTLEILPLIVLAKILMRDIIL